MFCQQWVAHHVSHLPTTTGKHCFGVVIKMGAATVDLEYPTGLVELGVSDAKIKFFAAEALCTVDGLLFVAFEHEV